MILNQLRTQSRDPNARPSTLAARGPVLIRSKGARRFLQKEAAAEGAEVERVDPV
jgi:hypothetical protein